MSIQAADVLPEKKKTTILSKNWRQVKLVQIQLQLLMLLSCRWRGLNKDVVVVYTSIVNKLKLLFAFSRYHVPFYFENSKEMASCFIAAIHS